MLRLFGKRKKLYFSKLIQSLTVLVNIGRVHFSAADVDHILSVLCGIH